MIDDRLSLVIVAKELGGSTCCLRKRLFPFPVKISRSDKSVVKQIIKEMFLTVGLILTGGKEFIVRCARTESMSAKDSVKNIINCAFNAICLILYACKVKHNYPKELSL